MTEPADLVLDRVTKRFGGTIAVDAVSFTAPPGSYVALLGPSGSGKTTVLSMVGGFVLPSEGRILIGGSDVSLVPPAKRPTATVFQDYALFPHMSVAGNIGFGLSVRGSPKAIIAARVEEALRLVGLEGFGPRSISAASGGQRQRIALARALAVDPSVLLLDEPLGALDLNLRRRMQDELRRIQRRDGRIFMHVTHDQEEAMAIADLIVIMNQGRIEDVGPPSRVYARPRTRFAAAFMGESAIIEGTVVEAAKGEIAVDTAFGRLTVEAERPIGARLSLALRPEAVRLGEAMPSDQPIGALTVEETVFQGSFVRVVGRGAGGLRMSAKTEPSAAPQAGATVQAAIRPGGLAALED